MKIHIQTEINAPAEKVWQILAHQFGDIAKWSSLVSTSHVVEAGDLPPGCKADPSSPTAGRSTTTPLGTIIEVIIDYSESKRELTFTAAEPPSIFAGVSDTQRVIAQTPDRCLVTFDIHLEPLGIFKLLNPILRRRIKSTMSGVQQDLKHYAETEIISSYFK